MGGDAVFKVHYDAETAAEDVVVALGGDHLALLWTEVVHGELRRRVSTRRGVGVAVGPARAGHPVSFHSLRCVSCGATWTGEEGEACPWCADWLDAARQRAERLHTGGDAA